MLTEDGVTGSSNVTVTFVEVGTPVAFGAGVRAATLGAVVSVAVVSNTTSTQ
jgi:hypothetical protein